MSLRRQWGRINYRRGGSLIIGVRGPGALSTPRSCFSITCVELAISWGSLGPTQGLAQLGAPRVVLDVEGEVFAVKGGVLGGWISALALKSGIPGDASRSRPSTAGGTSASWASV